MKRADRLLQGTANAQAPTRLRVQALCQRPGRGKRGGAWTDGRSAWTRVVHFEIPADDVARATEFYRSIFGWDLQAVPNMDYTMIRTVPVDEQQGNTMGLWETGPGG